jgi:short-subunit dehydrogenase
MSLRERYGPWALITGASEGVGAEIAKRLAAEGVNIAMVGRREGPMNELAAQLGGVATRNIVLDLNAPDAAKVIEEATADLEVGFVCYNAGAAGCVPPVSFLGKPLEHWQGILSRNTGAIVQGAYHFGSKMVERGRGGFVLIGSTAGWAGTANMAIYCGTKSFQIGFAESLWAEWSDKGVDVLAMVLGKTRTPAFERMFNGQPVGDDVDDCGYIADELFKILGTGPTWPPGPSLFSGLDRKDAVLNRVSQRSDLFRQDEREYPAT